MKFSGSIVTLGRGRVSSARRMNNGDRVFILDTGDALVEKRIPAGAKQVAYGSGTVVSYGDDCFRLDAGRLEKNGEFNYVRD